MATMVSPITVSRDARRLRQTDRADTRTAPRRCDHQAHQRQHQRPAKPALQRDDDLALGGMKRRRRPAPPLEAAASSRHRRRGRDEEAAGDGAQPPHQHRPDAQHRRRRQHRAVAAQGRRVDEIGRSSAATPRINSMLPILLPTTLPTAIPGEPASAACRLSRAPASRCRTPPASGRSPAARCRRAAPRRPRREPEARRRPSARRGRRERTGCRSKLILREDDQPACVPVDMAGAGITPSTPSRRLWPGMKWSAP